MRSALGNILRQAEALSRDDALRLVKHFEWLANRPSPQNFVGSHLEDVRAFRNEILAIAQAHGVGNVRIFGSMARGEARVDSDVDFLVDVCGQTKLWFPVELTRELSALLGRRVDVVMVQQL
ncbi:MAG: hypothetical protein HC857_17240 [Synechococcales cyanobacterium RU_4_20]|nr:hypothetical protein [Synechococcales cyanobacterium RU_4_20]NJR69410.1 hypothetical protein [Synechococcales cyanobacterium CRU_2_2]